ncbi:hypothetical protein [Pseudonocardia sp. ICBG1142]|uniref:hypothetical protein n=1 Tax=Pseudonocardia sp. ICBG1142 TaxID=2846760 RepID=UPI001CF6CA72|nr:hypothetical protein [Pseudonocardia sp. ICBG1142]
MLAEDPTLGEHGYGVYKGWTKTPTDRAAELRRLREELLSHRAEIDTVYDWLVTNLSPIKTLTECSYSLKHIAERAIGTYVSNGQLIAAALMAGYPTGRPRGHNVLVAVSRRDLKRVLDGRWSRTF